MPLWYRQQFGVTAAPGANFDTSGANTDNEVANTNIAPSYAGWVATLNVHFGGNGATVTARNMIWDSNGNIVAKSPQFTAPAAPALQSNTPASPAICALGTGVTYFIGFWRAPAGTSEWFVLASGNFDFNTDVSADVGTFTPTLCNFPFCGNIQAWALLLGSPVQHMYHLSEISFRAKRVA